nr:hypothetical protein [uncultured Campylobacter sp.]
MAVYTSYPRLLLSALSGLLVLFFVVVEHHGVVYHVVGALGDYEIYLVA